MPHPYSNYIEHAKWDDPKKIRSRKQAIVEPYRHLFGNSLPTTKQYWTMAGAYFDQDNNPLKGELGQLLQEDLITPEQFFGVDREETILSLIHI